MNNKSNKILFIFLLILYLIAVVVAWLSPYENYETSIYYSTPILFWMIIIPLFIFGIVISINSIYNKNKNKLNTFIGFILIGLCSLSVSTLSIIRSYNMNQAFGDVGTHISNLIYAYDLGSIHGIYVSKYIVTLISSNVINVDIIKIVDYSFIPYIFLFVIGMYLLSLKICKHKHESKLVLILTLLFPLGSGMMLTGFGSYQGYIPYMSALFMVPLSLYLLISIHNSNNDNKYIFLILFIIQMIIILISHIVVFCVLVLFILVFFSYYLIRLKSRKTLIYILILLLAVIFGILWIQISGYNDQLISSTQNIIPEATISSTQNIIPEATISSTQNIIPETTISSEESNQIFNGFGMDLMNEGMSVVSKLSTSIFNIAEIALLIFAPLILYSVFLISSIILKIKDRINYRYYYILSVTLIPIIIFAIINLISKSLGFHSYRLIPFVIIVGVFGGAILINNIIDKSLTLKNRHWKKIYHMAVILLLTISLFVGVFSFYPSYEINQHTTDHITESILNSADYLFTYGNNKYTYNDIDIVSINRLLFINPEPTLFVENGEMILHFGYDYSEYSGNIFDINTYVLIVNGMFMKHVNGLYHSSFPKWTKNELDHFNYDYTVLKIYNNNDVSNYIVNAQQ